MTAEHSHDHLGEAAHDHEHGHGHGGHGEHAGHDHTAGVNERSLKIAPALTGVFLVVELVGGFIAHSLALLSDAAHMFTGGG